MSYRLVVTEKPSVAQSIAKVLKVRNRKEGYLEGNGYLVSNPHFKWGFNSDPSGV